MLPILHALAKDGKGAPASDPNPNPSPNPNPNSNPNPDQVAVTLGTQLLEAGADPDQVDD